MAKLPLLVSISDLRQDAAKVLKLVQDSQEPLIITQRGRAAAVMQSLETFERSERHKELLQLLLKGEKEIAAGQGFELDAVLADSRRPLSGIKRVKILFTPSARSQFLAALAYIRADNPLAAQNLRQRSEEILRRLKQFPDSGRQIPEFPDLPFKEVVIPPYRFFYRLQEKTIWVVAVWHGAQIPDQPAT